MGLKEKADLMKREAVKTGRKQEVNIYRQVNTEYFL
jgi:hypothetical protein